MKRLDGRVPVESLDLDPTNPRLPEDVQGRPQAEILAYLYDHDVLDELIDSYLANGYFESEPLIVLPADATGRRIVVEGNRRLAALIILLQLPVALEADIPLDVEPPPSEEALSRVRRVPCIEVASYSDVASYLGFRHISGLKRWEPEAKARWLWRQVKEAEQKGSLDPFFDVGRKVGSNARGVRSAFQAYELLRYARDELSVAADVQHVMKDRFGVWTRLLGTANVPRYIGLTPSPRTYEEVMAQTAHIDEERFTEVLRDLTPTGGRSKALLDDSRDATVYSDVLGDEQAHRTLRQYNSLSLAVQVVEQGSFRQRLEDTTATLEILNLDVKRHPDLGDDDASAAESLFGAARALRSAVVAAVAGDDE